MIARRHADFKRAPDGAKRPPGTRRVEIAWQRPIREPLARSRKPVSIPGSFRGAESATHEDYCGFTRYVKCMDPNRGRAQLGGLLGILIVCDVSAADQRTAAASERPSLTIAGVTKERDGDHTLERLGQVLSVTGVITSGRVRLGQNAYIAYLQDATGAIQIFTRKESLMAGRFQRGDSVEARGVLQQFKGDPELMVYEVRRLFKGAIPQPHDVLAADVSRRGRTAQLVRVAGQIVPDRTSPTFAIRDRSGEVAVILSGPAFRAPDFLNRLYKGGAAQVVGIVVRASSSTAEAPEYRVVPRDPADIVFAPLPPYKAIAGGLGALVRSGWSCMV